MQYDIVMAFGYALMGMQSRGKEERKQIMRVYEYRAYYVPNKEQKEAGKEATIVLSSEMLAEDEETVRRTAIRALPAEYDAVIAQVKIEVRAFR